MPKLYGTVPVGYWDIVVLDMEPLNMVKGWKHFRVWCNQCCGPGSAWIRMIFGSWIRIRVKSLIRIRIKVKIQEL